MVFSKQKCKHKNKTIHVIEAFATHEIVVIRCNKCDKTIKKMTQRIAKKKQNRRYYLHRKVKLFTNVKARKMQIEVSEEIINNATPKQKKYLTELSGLGYNLQTFIPC